MLSKTTQYALKASAYLAKNSSVDHKILASDLAKNVEVPQAFLSKILQRLTSKGYVSSTKGPNGGYYFTPEQLQNSAYDVILAVENRDVMGHCAMSLTACNEQNPCALHEHIVAAKSALKRSLEQLTLNELSH